MQRILDAKKKKIEQAQAFLLPSQKKKLKNAKNEEKSQLQKIYEDSENGRNIFQHSSL